MKTFTRDLDFVNFTDKDGNEFKDLDFVNVNGVTVYESWKNLLASGVPPITLQKCKGVDLVDYKIYGESVQNSILPKEYQQVEYIESTGTQYIDTGIKPTQDISVEIDFLHKDKFNIFLYGSRTDFNSKDKHCYAISSSSEIYPQFYSFNTSVTYSSQHNTKYKIKNGKDGFYINNTLIQSYDYQDFSSELCMYLFGLNQNNTLERGFVGQIFSCKILNGKNVIRNLVPCYRKSDNVIGMYDLVENKFYTNQGTGTFLKGDNAQPMPTPEAPIEIESVGDKTKNLFENKNDSISSSDVYKGLDMRKWEKGAYTLQLRLKEGKQIPQGAYFGFLYAETSAFWLIQNGEINPLYKNLIVSANVNNLNGVTCYPSNKINALIDAFDIFLVKGDYNINNVPSYEPYGYKIPVKVSGRNLFDTTHASNVDNWSFSSSGDIGTYILNLPTGTYTITNEFITLPSGANMGIYRDTSNGASSLVYSLTSFRNNAIKTVDLSERDHLRVNSYFPGVNSAKNNVPKIFGNYINKMIIYKGEFTSETIPEYEPYIEPVTTNIYLDEPLRKVGNYADYIDFESGKVVRVIKPSQINENSSFGKFGAVTNYSAFYMENREMVKSDVLMNFKILSNKFRYYHCGTANTNRSWSGEYQIGTAVTSTYRRICFTLPNTITDSTSAKEWLKENPVDYYFPLETPIEETIELPNIPTLKGTTILEVDTTIQPSNMEVVYKGKEVK